MTFRDFADAGRRLAAVLPADLVDDAVVVAVPPGGLAVAAAVAEVLGIAVGALDVRRGDDGVTVAVPQDVTDRTVVVVDDGVETGTAARAVADALRAAGAALLVLAVPVCPREAEAHLRHRYDRVIALERPLVRRSLRWHYDTFA